MKSLFLDYYRQYRENPADVESLQKVRVLEIEVIEYKRNDTKIDEADIYQLNNFLIKCKALLQCICDEIKNGNVKSEDFYMHFAD